MANVAGSEPRALVTGLYLNEYDRVVKPQQRFLIPNYYIEYWVNRLGPTLSWIIVSLQQACWRENNDQCTISQSIIAEEIGMERRTVGRVLKENLLRHWFIPDIEYQKGVIHRASKTYQPLPYKYTVYLSIPLTPEHMAGLAEYFRQECPNPSFSAVEQAIAKLLELKSREALALLEKQYLKASRQFEAPLPLTELVEITTGLKMKDLALAKANELEQKLAGLHTHLTEIGHTICRQYFRLTWVPELGPAMAWLIMVLRSRCYYNSDQDELRDVYTWRKKDLAALIGQSRYNLRLLLTHPYAGHFFQLLDNQKHQITIRASMSQDPLIEEIPAEFWSRQPHSAAEEYFNGKNVEKYDMTLDSNVEFYDMTPLENVEFYDKDDLKNVEKRDMTPSKTLKNVTSLPPNVEINDTLKYSEDSVLDVVENDKNVEKAEFSDPANLELHNLLSQAGLAGVGLSRLCHREPPLDPRKVRAVVLYARANNLGPGYIYSHLTKDLAVDEMFLRFALLDEPVLRLFEQTVTEIKMSGGGFTPELVPVIPAEQLDLFAQFVETFAYVEAATVAATVRHRYPETRSMGLPGRGSDIGPALDSSLAAQQTELPDPAGGGGDNKLAGSRSSGLSSEVQNGKNTVMKETDILWTQVLNQLQLQMTRGTFDTWVKDTRLIAREGLNFTVLVSSEFAQDWLENRLRTTIQRAVMNLIKTEGDQRLPKVEIKFVVDGKMGGA